MTEKLELSFHALQGLMLFVLLQLSLLLIYYIWNTPFKFMCLELNNRHYTGDGKVDGVSWIRHPQKRTRRNIFLGSEKEN